MNNSITYSPTDPRTPLTEEELVAEILKLERVIGIVYCVRKGAIDVYKQLKATDFPALHIVNDLLSQRKRKDKKIVRGNSNLYLDHYLEIKTLTIVKKHGNDLKGIVKKKQKAVLAEKKEKQKAKRRE